MSSPAIKRRKLLAGTPLWSHPFTVFAVFTLTHTCTEECNKLAYSCLVDDTFLSCSLVQCRSQRRDPLSPNDRVLPQSTITTVEKRSCEDGQKRIHSLASA